MISWMTGDNKDRITSEELQRLAADPTIKARFNQACNELASQLGMAEDKREHVLKLAEDLARELSFIEALRERFGLILGIRRALEKFEKLYARERLTAEEIMRTRTLMARPIKTFAELFERTENKTSQLITIFRSINSQIQLIRACRDSLHNHFMEWDETIKAWQNVTVESTPESLDLLKRTYRFVCTNYPNESTW